MHVTLATSGRVSGASVFDRYVTLVGGVPAQTTPSEPTYRHKYISGERSVYKTNSF